MALTTQDVRDACDVFAPVYEASGGVDGRVSIEVDPRLAHDTAGTVAQALELAAAVDRPNVLIKIPATIEGLPAISQVLAAGVSVNVTLIFALDRYRGVMNAFLTGLEQAREHGVDLVDPALGRLVLRLPRRHRDRRAARRSSAPTRLLRCGARRPSPTPGSPTRPTRRSSRPLGGARSRMPGRTPSVRCGLPRGSRTRPTPTRSTSPSSSPPGTVNTMPEKTLEAVADHGEVTGDTVTPHYAAAAEVLDSLERLGISYTEVTARLERDGVAKFEAAWDELLAGVTRELERASA